MSATATKRKAGSESSLLLSRVVDFLNFDFDAASGEDLKKAGLRYYEFAGSDWKKKGGTLKKEILADLLPLVTGEPTDEMNERIKREAVAERWKGRTSQMKGPTLQDLITAKPRLYHGTSFYLDRLIAEINKMGLSVRLIRDSGEHDPAVASLGPGRRIVIIRGEKFIVSKDFGFAKSHRERFYGFIADALENKEFERLKRCLKCQRFFLAEDPRKKYCGDECRESYHGGEKAKERVRKSRNRKKLEEARAKRRARAGATEKQKGIQAFIIFLKKATGGLKSQTEIGPITKRIPGKWRTIDGWLKALKNGRTPEQIWKTLPNQVKNIFVDS